MLRLFFSTPEWSLLFGLMKTFSLLTSTLKTFLFSSPSNLVNKKNIIMYILTPIGFIHWYQMRTAGSYWLSSIETNKSTKTHLTPAPEMHSHISFMIRHNVMHYSAMLCNAALRGSTKTNQKQKKITGENLLKGQTHVEQIKLYWNIWAVVFTHTHLTWTESENSKDFFLH